MIKKKKIIKLISNYIENNNSIYLVDLSGLTSNQIFDLRKNCYDKQIKLKFVKNTLFKKAIKNSKFEKFYPVLKGPTALMTSNINNYPAILINNFKKKFSLKKEYLKAAYIEDMLYLGEISLNTLINIKSKNELILDIIFMLKSELFNLFLLLNSKNKIYNIIFYLLKK
ncbi:50S ribosomal protein L10 [Candidatus Karelsulcia muelleri]|uniref:Large ribosomal subunit protein uL10 n=1 Tax=Candidatus Karelsulcia muelleri PSPU TaxID=1189303 RepID=A0AAD1AYX6_9FLAO|nr:50S ribosomal protein L10 [Candidatus Karelsulcia muelleri]NJJ98843.1 50S ribosomal protein L10 [Candidatus Karelsulcia muelleri]BAO66247.1 50S ribosomal protein L10 [Candidatus Karelsulcia muelleri PSPU]